MQAAEPREFGVLKPGNRAEYPDLLAMPELCLKPHHVEQGAQLVVLPQLNHGVGLFVALVGVGQPHGLHRAMAQRFDAAFGHDFDGEATVEIRDVFPVFEGGFFASDQRLHKREIPVAIEGAIEVVAAVAARSDFVVAGLKPGFVHIDAVAVNDRSDGVEEGKGAFACEPGDRLREVGRGQRTRGDDVDIGMIRNYFRHFPADNLNIWLGRDRLGDRGGESVAINRERAARRHLVGVGAGHDQGIHPPHFKMHKADGVCAGFVRSEGVGAYKLGERAGLVRGGGAQWPHLVQDCRHARLRELPGGFAAREAAPHHMHRGERGGRAVGLIEFHFQPQMRLSRPDCNGWGEARPRQ